MAEGDLIYETGSSALAFKLGGNALAYKKAASPLYGTTLNWTTATTSWTATSFPVTLLFSHIDGSGYYHWKVWPDDAPGGTTYVEAIAAGTATTLYWYLAGSPFSQYSRNGAWGPGGEPVAGGYTRVSGAALGTVTIS